MLMIKSDEYNRNASSATIDLPQSLSIVFLQVTE